MASIGGWENLPGDILRQIIARLPDAVDRAAVMLVSPHWSAVSMAMGIAHHPLPHLLMAVGGRLSCRRVALGARVLALADVPDSRGARVLGVCGQSFAVELAEPARSRMVRDAGTGRYALVGFDGQTTALPEMLRVPIDVRSFEMVAHTVVGGPDFYGAIISSNMSTLAFWGVGVGDTLYWTPPVSTDFRLIGQWPRMLTSSPVEDMLRVSNGSFYVLSADEGLYRYRPVVTPGNTLTTTRRRIIQDSQDIAQPPPGQMVARYLCWIGADQFLLVRRFFVPGQGTMAFEVFRNVSAADDGGRITTSWTKVWNLHGRTIFLGRGCSRVVRTRRAFIYFLDDAGFRNTPAGGPYPCSDTGRYEYAPEASPPTAFEHDVPPHPPSASSPSIWFR